MTTRRYNKETEQFQKVDFLKYIKGKVKTT